MSHLRAAIAKARAEGRTSDAQAMERIEARERENKPHVMEMGAEATRQHLQSTHGRSVRSSIRDVRVLRIVHLKEHS